MPKLRSPSGILVLLIGLTIILIMINRRREAENGLSENDYNQTERFDPDFNLPLERGRVIWLSMPASTAA